MPRMTKKKAAKKKAATKKTNGAGEKGASLKMRCLGALNPKTTQTTEEVAAKIGMPKERVSTTLSALKEAGQVELVKRDKPPHGWIRTVEVRAVRRAAPAQTAQAAPNESAGQDSPSMIPPAAKLRATAKQLRHFAGLVSAFQGA